MEKIFGFEVSIDVEKKEGATRIGYNKEDFDEESIKLIEHVSKEFGQMVLMSYQAKFQEKKEDA